MTEKKIINNFKPRKHNHKNTRKRNAPITLNMNLENIIINNYNPLREEDIRGPEHERRLISELTIYLGTIKEPFKPLYNLAWTKNYGEQEVDLLQIVSYKGERRLVRYEVKTKEESIGEIRKKLTSIKGVIAVLVEETSQAEERIRRLTIKGLYNFSGGAILLDKNGWHNYIKLNI